jgi:hypothetical protein
MKARIVLLAVAATALLLVAGCGGNGGDSTSDPASLTPPGSPLYLEATIQPQGEDRTDVEKLFAEVSGVDTDLGRLIVSELESSASSSGEELDFENEIQPWLGEKGGLFFQRYDGHDFGGYGVAIQSTDTGATQDFVDAQARSSDEPVENETYEGVDFKVEDGDGTAVGVIGDFLAFAEDEETFEAMVDASSGESLAAEGAFASAIDAAPSGSLADVYVDVGGLIDQSRGSIDPEARKLLDSAGIDAEEATAVASLIPGSDQVEIDVSADLGGQSPPSGDASALLGDLPADSVVAVASADFGARLEEAIDSIDAEGIAGEVPPHKFKSTLKEAGIDVEKIASSLEDVGVFAEGSSRSSLGGAVVLTTDGSGQATNTVSNLGLLLRASGTPGITAISGKATGFSIRSEELGPKPLVVGAEGDRIAIAYGLPAAKQALSTGSGATLADDPTYKEAVSALEGTPITGFVDGPGALRLASAATIGSEEQQGFEEAKPYLSKIDYLAIGSGSSGDRATAKLIAGIGK